MHPKEHAISWEEHMEGYQGGAIKDSPSEWCGTNLRGVREEELWEEQGGVKTLSLSGGAVHGWGTT